MVITAEDVKTAGIEAPVLVGGAALSENFTRNKIAPSSGRAVCFAKDSMTGLRLMNQLTDPKERESMLRAHTFSGAAAPVAIVEEAPPPMTQIRSAKVGANLPIQSVPISTAKSGTCRSSPRSGAISIRSCCTGGAVWQFFEAERDGNSINLFAPGATSPLHTFHFGRQRRQDG